MEYGTRAVLLGILLVSSLVNPLTKLIAPFCAKEGGLIFGKVGALANVRRDHKAMLAAEHKALVRLSMAGVGHVPTRPHLASKIAKLHSIEACLYAQRMTISPRGSWGGLESMCSV